MLSVSPNSVARSSLEEMLESLRQRDESEKPKDLPPALPARPRATSRARLPSTKRPLPTSFEEPRESETAQSSFNCDVKKGETEGQRRNSFGAKKVKEVEAGEQPYVMAASNEKEHKQKFRDSDDTLRYFMKEKLHVWCRLHNGLWESGIIKSSSGEKALVLLSDGSVVTVPTRDLVPANPDSLGGMDDLVELIYLNEPSVLQNLQHRYSQDVIYSKAGPILVAVNPFKDVQTCENDIIAAYREKFLDSPHVYAVAHKAYTEIMKDKRNQSIIISGESGAGKTETAKIAMQYLAAVGRGSGGLDSQLLQTSCVLEAFGNAKTAKNDNSSRFGKLMEIYFSAAGQICGAKIQTSLLEKSRVVQLAQGDRSYHIFYQLCSGAPSGLRGRLGIKRAADYNYLNQGNCLVIENSDDAQKFHMLMEALNTLGICKEEQEHIFEMLAAVLWLGNISFLVTDKQNHIEVVADEAITNAASLIGCNDQNLMLALSTRKIQVGKDEVTRRLTLQQAINRRDALAKSIYASLFDWLVEHINLSLAMGKHNSGLSISILDIYGFESFRKNSFEQLCINYANERLHQHFNRHLFKLEQEEYELDGIDFKKVDFKDNQDCLDLFEKKPIGLISLLDEVSNFPKATNLSFATKLKQQLSVSPHFKGEESGTFSVHHYAGEVVYDTAQFLEKNTDPLHSETIQLLSLCTGRFPQYFASALLEQSQGPKNSVATKFKAQLFNLIQHLESTTPHFICCIKPNSKQIPGVFEQNLILQQLRSCGLLDVLRISRSGFPIRITHQEFTRRYGFLLPENMASQDPLSMSIAILQQFDILPEMYQVGYTKLYFRAGQIEALQDISNQVKKGTLKVQKRFHGHRARPNFHELKGLVTTMQSYIRGEIARKKYKDVHHVKQLTTVVQIQSVIRGWLARRHFSHLQSSKQSIVGQPGSSRRISEVKVSKPLQLLMAEQDPSSEMSSSVVEELQKRIFMAEVALGDKEKENAALKEQVQQLEARWTEYEGKMKSMEEMWQKQMESLQTSLAAAKKSLASDNTIPLRLNGAQSPQFYDSEDTSMGTQTPGGSTPARFLHSEVDTNGGVNPMISLTKEFEQRRQTFEIEAQAIQEAKSGQLHSSNPVEEFKRLKLRFESWKKDYKIRLKEAKVKAHKLGQNEGEKQRRRWWGKKSNRL